VGFWLNDGSIYGRTTFLSKSSGYEYSNSVTQQSSRVASRVSFVLCHTVDHRSLAVLLKV